MNEPIIGQNEANAEGQPEEQIVMQIYLSRDGQLRVKTPILNDKTACYGILELAKDAIRDAHKPQIVKPNGAIMNFIRNGKK